MSGTALAPGTGETPNEDPATRECVGPRDLMFSILYYLPEQADSADVRQASQMVRRQYSEAVRRGTAIQECADEPEAAGARENTRSHPVGIVVNTVPFQRENINRPIDGYAGVWLPLAPVAEVSAGPDVAYQEQHSDSVPRALLADLGTLSPLERAASVLHGVFGYHEIAGVLGCGEVSVRRPMRASGRMWRLGTSGTAPATVPQREGTS